MKKLFFFILIVLSLSSCTGFYYTTPSYNYSHYNDYRNPYYRPYTIWTDIHYTNYYRNYNHTSTTIQKTIKPVKKITHSHRDNRRN